MAGTDTRLDIIRNLLNELEDDLKTSDDLVFAKNFDALEIPDIVSQVIRFLQPILTPYESAIYWYMFDLAILRIGNQYCRVSTRGLMDGVVRSTSGQSDTLSYGAVKKALQGLENHHAIIRTGEPNREGTPYRVLLPEEIPASQKLMEDASPETSSQIDMATELDFYNVHENRLKVFERDNYICKYCQKQLTRFTATLDHVQPVSKGGDNSFDNLITACLHCNSRRGNRPVMDIISKVDRLDVQE